MYCVSLCPPPDARENPRETGRGLDAESPHQAADRNGLPCEFNSDVMYVFFIQYLIVILEIQFVVGFVEVGYCRGGRKINIDINQD